MPDFGSPVAQNVKGPSLDTLSGILSIQQKQQALTSGAIGIQQQQQTLQRGAAETQSTQQSAAQRAAIAKVDWGKYSDESGMVSTDKMLGDSGLQQATGDQFLDVIKSAAGVRQSQLQNKSSLVGLNNGLRDQFSNTLGSLRTDDDVIADNSVGRQKVKDRIAQFGQAGGPDADRIAKIFGPVAEHAPQGKLVGGINHIQLMAMDASRQAGAQSPSYADTGAGFAQTNPQAAGGNLGAPPAQEALGGAPGLAKGLPPTTPVMRNGVPGYKGDPQIASGPALGQTAGVEANVSDMNTHFSGLQNASQGATLISGLTGNIKALATKAITGTESDRQSYVNGLLNTLGVGDKASGNLQTDTDLLRKQLAMINTNTKASTDAQQALVQAAQPNSHMNAAAVSEAADQVASQVQLNMMIRNKLSSFKYANGGSGDSSSYQDMRQKIESVSDPRAVQWKNLGPGSPEAQKYLQNLNTDDRQSLRKSVEGMRKLGLF